VLAEAVEIRKIYKKKIPMTPLESEQRIRLNNAQICYLCKHSFVTNPQDKEYCNKCNVADHCHVTGKFRGSAHYICNL